MSPSDVQSSGFTVAEQSWSVDVSCGVSSHPGRPRESTCPLLLCSGLTPWTCLVLTGVGVGVPAKGRPASCCPLLLCGPGSHQLRAPIGPSCSDIPCYPLPSSGPRSPAVAFVFGNICRDRAGQVRDSQRPGLSWSLIVASFEGMESRRFLKVFLPGLETSFKAWKWGCVWEHPHLLQAADDRNGG